MFQETGALGFKSLGQVTWQFHRTLIGTFWLSKKAIKWGSAI